jgi:hypothetical protein
MVRRRFRRSGKTGRLTSILTILVALALSLLPRFGAGATTTDSGRAEQLARDVDVEGEGKVEDSYIDPTYGWTIAWDPAAWEFSGPYQIVLNEGDETGTYVSFLGENFSSQGAVTFAAVSAYDGDPQECLDHRTPREGEDSVANLREPALDPPAAPDGTVWGRFLFDVAQYPDQIVYVECRTLVEGEVVLAINWHLTEADRCEQALATFEELIAGLDLSDDHPTEGTAAATAVRRGLI